MVLKDMWPCFSTCAARRGNLQHAELMHCSFCDLALHGQSRPKYGS